MGPKDPDEVTETGWPHQDRSTFLSVLLPLSSDRGKRFLMPVFVSRSENERLAVDALRHGRVRLMRADPDFIERTVVLAARVIRALLDGTFDTMVLLAIVHFYDPFGDVSSFRSILLNYEKNTEKSQKNY